MLLGINAFDTKSMDQDGEVAFYDNPQADGLTKLLKISADGNDFVMMVATMQDEELTGQRQIKLKRGQFLVI